MLISLKVNNCFIYNTETEFTMRSDMRNKHFPSNVVSVNSTNVLKSAIIMGPNNVGKTNFVKCINAIRGIMLNEGKKIIPNIFNQNSVCELLISFCYKEYEYCLALKYCFLKDEFDYEKFSRISYDVHKNKKEQIILLRDTKNKEYVCNTEDEEEKNAVISAMKVTAKNNLLIYLLDTSQFSVLSDIKDIITSFAKKIDIVDMNNIPMKKTIEMLKNSDDTTKKIVNFILNSDLYLENYQYLKNENAAVIINKLDSDFENDLQEKVLKDSDTFMEQLHLFSTYKGSTVPSLIFDSTGTKKIACLASYVIDALEKDYKLPCNMDGKGEEYQKEFIKLFGSFLRLQNILKSFDEFDGNELLSEADMQDYVSIYNDLHEHFKVIVAKDDVSADIVFEMELIRQIVVNIDYIIMLVAKFAKDNHKNKEIPVEIVRAINSNPELKPKRELIEQFIEIIDDTEDTHEAWIKFRDAKKVKEFDKIVADENLKMPETKELVEKIFRIGTFDV